MTMNSCRSCGVINRFEEGLTIQGLLVRRCLNCGTLQFECDQKTFSRYRDRMPKKAKPTLPKGRYPKYRYKIARGNNWEQLDDKFVEGRLLSPHFAAHHPPTGRKSGWNVTHLPTGVKAITVGSLRAARYVAQAFEKLHPCLDSKDMDEVGRETPRRLVQYVRWMHGRSKKDIKTFESWNILND